MALVTNMRYDAVCQYRETLLSQRLKKVKVVQWAFKKSKTDIPLYCICILIVFACQFVVVFVLYLYLYLYLYLHLYSTAIVDLYPCCVLTLDLNLKLQSRLHTREPQSIGGNLETI